MHPRDDINNTNPAHQGADEDETGRDDSRPGQDHPSRSAPAHPDDKRATPGQGSGSGGHG